MNYLKRLHARYLAQAARTSNRQHGGKRFREELSPVVEFYLDAATRINKLIY